MTRSCSVAGISREQHADPARVVADPLECSRLSHQLRELLDEQRDAAGPIAQLIDQRGWQLRLDALLEQRRHFLACQRRQRERCLIGADRPRRLEVGAECQQREDGIALAREHELVQEFERRGVAPLQVLDDEQDRPVRRVCAQPVTDGGQHGFSLARRREHERLVACTEWQGQQRGEQRYRFLVRHPEPFEVFDQPIEPGLRGLDVQGVGQPLEKVDDRVEAAVLALRRAAPFDDRPLCGCFLGRRGRMRACRSGVGA